MHSELLFLTLSTHGHCARDWRIKMCGRKGNVALSCTGVGTDCSPAECILIQYIYSSMVEFRYFFGILKDDSKTEGRTQNHSY